MSVNEPVAKIYFMVDSVDIKTFKKLWSEIEHMIGIAYDIAD
jgi:hypothetical protein